MGYLSTVKFTDTGHGIQAEFEEALGDNISAASSGMKE